MVQIFISHSSKDKWLIDPICENLRRIGVDPYLAEIDTPIGYPLPEKLENAIQNSVAVFLILTSNVVNNPTTRDNINWEVSAAHTMKKKIFVFRQIDVDVPMMISYITDYYTFDPMSRESLAKALMRINELGQKFRLEADITSAFLLVGLTLGIPIIGAVVAHFLGE